MLLGGCAGIVIGTVQDAWVSSVWLPPYHALFFLKMGTLASEPPLWTGCSFTVSVRGIFRRRERERERRRSRSVTPCGGVVSQHLVTLFSMGPLHVCVIDVKPWALFGVGGWQCPRLSVRYTHCPHNMNQRWQARSHLPPGLPSSANQKCRWMQSANQHAHRP